MKNIEKIKEMDAAQLAGFLVESGADVPTEFCDILCALEGCEECTFCGADGDKRAWRLWLEYDGEDEAEDQKQAKPKEVQTDKQDASEQGRSTKKTDKQVTERSAGSGPADRRNI